MKDPIVEEVRHHRMEHTRKFGGDLKAICDDLQRMRDEQCYKVVRLTPRRITPKGKENDQNNVA